MSVSLEDDDQSGARLLQRGPGRKQVWRYYGAEDQIAADIILGVCVRSDRFHRGLRAGRAFFWDVAPVSWEQEPQSLWLIARLLSLSL